MSGWKLYGEPAELDAVVYVNGTRHYLLRSENHQEAVTQRTEHAYDEGADAPEYMIDADE